MIVFLIAVLLLVMGAVVAVVLGRTGDLSVEMADPVSPLAPLQLPDGPLGPADLALVRFDRALRGYRMDQVDELLDRLRRQLVAAAPLECQPRAATTEPPMPPGKRAEGPSEEPIDRLGAHEGHED